MLDVNGQRLFLGTLNSLTAPQFAVRAVTGAQHNAALPAGVSGFKSRCRLS